MDNRLVLAVLFVTLSWVSVGTYAQTTAANNMTTVSGNMTSPPNATTAPHMTTAPGNMTSPPNATTAPHMTTAPGNMTSPPNATTAPTMAPTMATASGNNMTGSPPSTTMAPTMAPNTTVTTTAPPLVPNTTVETLQTDVSSTECGTEQLCAAEPSSCDPSTGGSCFFLAAKRQSGQNFEFALAGESDGYLAATLSTDSTLGGNDTTYVCANNNSAVQFFGAVLNDGQLVLKELNVNSVKGKITGTKIQCTFAATVPTPVTRSTSFALAISTGPYNSTSGSLGSPNTQLKSSVLNLASPNSTVTNQLSANTTTSPNTTTTTTTNHGITFQQSLTQALLISAGMLSLTML